MNNRAHLRPKDYDSNGDIIPMACKEEKGDLISREALKKNCAEVVRASNNSDFIPCPTWNKAMELIDNAPTVDTTEQEENAYNEGYAHGLETKRPQGEWIHVSERLPESRDWYLGLFKEPDTDFIGIPYICDYVGKVTKGTTNEGWILRHCTDVDNVPDYFRNLICVAWQPLPKPYKKGGTE